MSEMEKIEMKPLGPTPLGPPKNAYLTAIGVIAALVLVACHRSSELSAVETTFNAKLIQLSASSKTVELERLTQFDWDLVCVSYPYDGVEELLGGKNGELAVPKNLIWEGSEQFSRFVFFRKGVAINVLRVDTSDIFLQPIKRNMVYANCLKNPDALLVMSPSKTGRQAVVEFVQTKGVSFN